MNVDHRLRTGVAQRTTPAALKRADRRLRVLELRKAGATYAQIAKAMDIGLGTVAKDVRRALEDVEARELQSAEDLRALDLGRLDAMLRGLWVGATTGDTGSVRAALGILERRAKMLGLDAPKEHHVGVQTWTQLAQAVVDLGDDPDAEGSGWTPAGDLPLPVDVEQTAGDDRELALLEHQLDGAALPEEPAACLAPELWIDQSRGPWDDLDPTAMAPIARLEALATGVSWLDADDPEDAGGVADPPCATLDNDEKANGDKAIALVGDADA